MKLSDCDSESVIQLETKLLKSLSKSDRKGYCKTIRFLKKNDNRPSSRNKGTNSANVLKPPALYLIPSNNSSSF